VIAIVLNEGDELIAAELAGPEDDLLLVSRKARSVRFTASDEALRPMGRATAGVRGMRFAGDDELLSMSVVSGDRADDLDVFVVTDGGYAKRTPVREYRVQGRGGLGILAARVVDERGSLVGALIVHENDEVLAITSGGGVIRTRAADVRRTSRATMGVRLINLAGRDAVVAIARNAEDDAADDTADAAGDGEENPS
jgi:DNA gyrase subunit A